MKRVVVDTGPIVALLNASDSRHQWTRDVMDRIEPPLATCEAVISEACFLLHRIHGGQDAVMSLLARDVLAIDFSLRSEHEAVRKLMQRYKSVPMSVADACLVRMSELHDKTTVLTLDSDFGIYRRNRREAIPTIRP